MYQGSDYDVYSSSSEPFAQARPPVWVNDVENLQGQEMTSPVYNEPPPPYTEKQTVTEEKFSQPEPNANSHTSFCLKIFHREKTYRN